MSEVFIPSRGRAELLCKTIPAWLALGANVNVVVAPEDVSDYTAVMAEHHASWQKNAPHPCKIELLQLKSTHTGMGKIRQFCLKEAVIRRLEWIIMADDDIYPHWTSNLDQIEAHVLHDFVLGMGCVVSQHDLLLGDEAWRIKEGMPIFCASGYGFRMFAINIETAKEIGGFDPELDVCFEDAEFMRQGVAKGFTWWLDPSLRAVPLGKRFAAGGIADMTGSTEERATRTEACQRRVAATWPGFGNLPPARAMFPWKRFFDAKLPGWRSVTEWEYWEYGWYVYDSTQEFIEVFPTTLIDS